MKKTVYLLFCLCLVSFSSYASWDSAKIKFSDSNTSETIQKTGYNIIVTKDNVTNDGVVTISISIKNNQTANFLYLFDRTVSKKELRQQYKIIVKDEGCRRMLETNYCKIISGSYCIVPLQYINLCQVQINEGSESRFVLPIYIAKKKGWFSNKMQISDWDLMELAISIEERTDHDIPRISRQCDSIIDVISKQQFCRHYKHVPTLEQQEAPFKKAVTELQQIILTKLSTTPTHSKYYSQYEELKNRLDRIDFKQYEVNDCGEARVVPSTGTTHKHCKYCDMSLKEIFEIADVLYQQVDNSLIDKKTALIEANQILDCCKNSPKHASEWKNRGSKYRKAIEKGCDKIKKYK